MSHPLDTLPGIGAGRRARLEAAGLHSLEDLVAAGVEAVASVPHVPRPVAERAVTAAAALLDAEDAFLADDSQHGRASAVDVSPLDASPAQVTPPTPTAEPVVVPESAPTALPDSKHHRRIDRLRDLVQQARRHAKDAPKSKQRSKARRELRDFGRTLGALRQRVDQLSKKERRQLRKQLDEARASLERLTGGKPKDRRLRRTRKEVAAVHERLRKKLR